MKWEDHSMRISKMGRFVNWERKPNFVCGKYIVFCDAYTRCWEILDVYGLKSQIHNIFL